MSGEPLFAQSSFDLPGREKGFNQNRDYLSYAPFEHIDTFNGSVVLTFDDLVLAGNGGRELRFRRTYTGGENPRWAFGIAGMPMRINERPNPPQPSVFDTLPQILAWTPSLTMADGARRKTLFMTNPGLPNSFNWVTTGQFMRYDRSARIVYMPDGTQCHYDSEGRLVRFYDAFGNTVTLDWTTQAGWLYVTQFFNGTAAEASRMVSIELHPATSMPLEMSFEGSTWLYNYSNLESTCCVLLDSVEGPESLRWEYTYDGFHVASVLTPAGGRITYTYATQVFEALATPPDSVSLRVLASRATSGTLPGGTWEYTYVGVTPSTTVRTPSQHRITFTHGRLVNDDVLDGGWGVLTRVVEQKIAENQWTPVEQEERTYTVVPSVGYRGYGTPELSRRIITRYGPGGPRAYETRYAYGTENFGDYHNPATITECGDPGPETTGDCGTRRRRQTSRVYRHVGFPFMVGLVEREQVSAEGGSFLKEWTYDGRGFMRTSNVFGVRKTYEPDERGNLHRFTTGSGAATTFRYSWGVPSSVTTEHTTMSRSVSKRGTIDSQTEGGRTTTFTYDHLFRVRQTTPPGGVHPIQVAYTATTTTTTRGSSEVVATLDGFGRVIATRNEVNVVATTGYDAENRKVFEGHPFYDGAANRGVELFYDALGRVIERRHPGGNSTTFAYRIGEVEITNEAGRSTLQKRLAFGDPDDNWLTELVDARQKTWQYRYNGIGQLARVTAPDGIQRNWSYYPQTNLLHEETHPESGETTYGYDAAGNLVAKTDAKGTEFVYAYDGSDRLTSITAGGQTTTIVYEPNSDARRKITIGQADTTFSYERETGRLRSRVDVVEAKTFSTFYTYDRNDRLEKITYPSGREVQYAYDNEGRILRVFDATAGGRDYGNNFTYHASGAVTRYVAGNTIPHELTYDDNRLWPLSVHAGDLHLSYENYDPAGNVRRIRDLSRSGHDQHLTYDALDRLVEATGPYAVQAYAYDDHGNRTTVNGTPYSYVGNTLRLETQGALTFGYDNNGNVTSINNQVLTYTPQNMLATVDGPVSSYLYDGDNWRVRKTTGGVDTFYVRGPNNAVLSEWTGPGTAGEKIRDYIYAGSRMIAVVER